MAYEFKKLSAVEVVAEPAESANVLIEENGVIKKAPKTAVGGAGNDVGGADLVILCEGNTATPGDYNFDSMRIISGSYDAVVEKAKTVGFADIHFYCRYLLSDSDFQILKHYVSSIVFYDSEICIFTAVSDYSTGVSVYITESGEFHPDWD